MLSCSPVVALDAEVVEYPPPPFHPSSPYPEYPFDAHRAVVQRPNAVYDAVRRILRDLCLDVEHFGTPEWNPFRGMVRPGGTVVLKPNLVISEHALGQRGIEAAVAHGAILRPLADYASIALEGTGRIVIADSPLKEVDFPAIVERAGLSAITDFYQDASPIRVELLDIRDRYVARNASGFMTDLTSLPGDLSGYKLVDLRSESMFHDVAGLSHRLRSTAVYYEKGTDQFHTAQSHIYSIPNTLLEADLVISVAKLKTHRKGGITLSLKNAVGITNEKRSLPHHRMGPPSKGGDSIADGARLDARLEDRFRDLVLSHPAGRQVLSRFGGPLRLLGRRVLRAILDRLSPVTAAEATILEGDWYGNDTVWRMALDLNRVLLYTARDGSLSHLPQRHYLSIIDGIVAGEGEGPLYPDPLPCGALVGGLHPVAVDLVAAALMGFDYEKIPMLREALIRDWPLKPGVHPSAMRVVSNRASWTQVLRGGASPFRFRASAGWTGHIEQVVSSTTDACPPDAVIRPAPDIVASRQ